MLVTRRLHWTLGALAAGFLGVAYAFSWFQSAVGYLYDDGVYLLAARGFLSGHDLSGHGLSGYAYRLQSSPVPAPLTGYPPLFALLLAPLTGISMSPHWLKLLPLLCAGCWFALTWRLLRKLGASNSSASFLVAATAASGAVISFSTALLPDSLFAALITAALLLLLDGERPYTAGLVAGLATVTKAGGAPIVAAGIFLFLLRGRRTHAVQFALAAMLLAAPWYGWAAAEGARDSALRSLSDLNIFHASLGLSEKLRVLSSNILAIFFAPFQLLTGLRSLAAALITGALLLWSLARRRQLLPDLFLLFYCASVVTWTVPPASALGPVLPLLLWLIWRSVEAVWTREAAVAAMLLLLATECGFDAYSLLRRPHSAASSSASAEKLFNYLRTVTPPSSIVLADLDPLVYLETGRHAVRGFRPNGYELFYAPSTAAPRHSVHAFELLRALRENHVDFVVSLPTANLAEAPGFDAAVLALERDGSIEPVPIEGLAPEYRLFQVTAR